MTTENSRADALTDLQREAIEFAAGWFDQSVLPNTPYSGYAAALRELFAAFPVEQPAAAPINQGHGWVNPRPDGAKARCGGPAICHVCQAEAGRLPKVRNEPPPMPTCKPAPSPADERAVHALDCQYILDDNPWAICTCGKGSPNNPRAASASETGAEGAKPCAEGRMPFNLTHEQVSALYLLLFRRVRPEFGWMEEPLVAIEAALKPAHDAIHDRGFNAMNRQFFGDDRMALDEARMPDQIAPAQADARVGLTETFENWWKSLEGTYHRHDEFYIGVDGDWIHKNDVEDIYKTLRAGKTS